MSLFDTSTRVVAYHFLTEEERQRVEDHALEDWNGDRWWINRSDDPVMTELQETVRPRVEEIVGVPLVAEHCAFRIYQPGDDVKPHVDPAPPIDVSVSIAIKNHHPEGYVGWPLWIGEYDQVLLSEGNAVIFAGLNHRREPFDVPEGYYQIQGLLFYTYA